MSTEQNESESIENLKDGLNGKETDNEKKGIDFKGYAILGLLFLIITSDVFQDNVLANFNGALDGRAITTTGAIISAICLIIAHILLIHNL